MISFDFHMHSSCSDDAHRTMTEMAKAASEKNLDVICFTDHVDTDDGFTPNPSCFDNWEMMKAQYADAVSAFGEKLDIRLGIELGQINHHPELAGKIAATPGLDFIIGSVHCVRGEGHFYYRGYESLEQCQRLMESTLDEYLEITMYPECYDVLGHVDYCARCMFNYGFIVSAMDYRDKLEAVYRSTVAVGRGIELNVSGFRNPIGKPCPEYSALKLYRDCGGEIVTVGSDSHSTRFVGSDIQQGYDMLREAGFKYATIFKNRKPEFIKL